MSEVWLSFSQVIALMGVSRETGYRYLRAGRLQSRHCARRGRNGRPIQQVALSSLAPAAQALYWSQRRAVSVYDNTSMPEAPGFAYSDLGRVEVLHG